jgi:hypothetical protein
MSIWHVEGLILEPTGDDHLVYNDADSSAHVLNPMAYRVFQVCDGAAGAEQIAQQLTSEGPDPVTLEVVWLALDELSEARLITIEDAEPHKVNRRDLILKIGVGAAAAAMLPVVEMIVAGDQASTLPLTHPSPTHSHPTGRPSSNPTMNPTMKPTLQPTRSPTERPTRGPTQSPTRRPTGSPTPAPTASPTPTPTTTPTTTPAPDTEPTSTPATTPTTTPTPAPQVGGAGAAPKFTG